MLSTVEDLSIFALNATEATLAHFYRSLSSVERITIDQRFLDPRFLHNLNYAYLPAFHTLTVMAPARASNGSVKNTALTDLLRSTAQRGQRLRLILRLKEGDEASYLWLKNLVTSLEFGARVSRLEGDDEKVGEAEDESADVDNDDPIASSALMEVE